MLIYFSNFDILVTSTDSVIVVFKCNMVTSGRIYASIVVSLGRKAPEILA